MYGSIFLLTLKFENVINLLLLCLSNLEYKTILLCCHKQSPSKCYSGRFFYYNTFLDSIFFWILTRTTFVGHTVGTKFVTDRLTDKRNENCKKCVGRNDIHTDKFLLLVYLTCKWRYNKNAKCVLIDSDTIAICQWNTKDYLSKLELIQQFWEFDC